MSNIIDQLESEQLKEDVPEFGPGDTVRVQVRVKEGSRERLQAYEGVVLAKKKSRPQFLFYGAKNDRRRGRRAGLPDPQPVARRH